jgi:hypothetical protein
MQGAERVCVMRAAGSKTRRTVGAVVTSAVQKLAGASPSPGTREEPASRGSNIGLAVVHDQSGNLPPESAMAPLVRIWSSTAWRCSMR